MESADPRHPRRRAIDQLTSLITQAEEAVARYRLAMQQQPQNGSDPSRTSARLRMAEERVALLRQSFERVLADVVAAPLRRKRRVRSYAS